jgi:hypothetical protein
MTATRAKAVSLNKQGTCCVLDTRLGQHTIDCEDDECRITSVSLIWPGIGGQS